MQGAALEQPKGVITMRSVIHSLSVLVLASLAAACASPSIDPSIDDDEMPVKKASMPMPSGIWQRATNAEHYKVFATQDEAKSWFDGFESARARMEGRTANAVVAHDDPRYALAEQKVAIMWSAFQKVLPRDTEGLSAPPRVVIVDREDVNAYAVFDPKLRCADGAPEGCSPHVFVVHTSSLVPIADKRVRGEGLEGLFAHELAHHVLKHSWPGNDAKITKYYPATAKTFGFETPDDAVARATAAAWLEHANAVGPYPLEELNGLPLSSFGPGVFWMTRSFLVQKGKAVDPEACARVDLDGFKKVLVAHVAPETQAMDDDAATRAAFDAASKKLIAEERACVANVPGSLTSIMAEQFGVPAERFEQGMGPEDKAIIAAAPSAYDALLALTKARYAAMRALDVSAVRAYTYEEQADDVAVNVLFQAKRDARSLATFFRWIVLDEAARRRCDAVLRAGDEPPYGVLTDQHHAACWRVDHANKLVTRLSK